MNSSQILLGGRADGSNASGVRCVQSAAPAPVLPELRGAFIAAARAGHASPACREMARFLERAAAPEVVL